VSDLIARLKASRFLRFLIVGGFGFLVSEATLAAMLHGVHSNDTVAWCVAFLCAATFTWWGNRNLTFADRKAHGAAGMLTEYGKFLAANALGGAVNFVVFKGLGLYAPQPLNNPFLALACGVLAGLVFNFTVSKLLVFRS
jgi:putative flippase GtrA